MSTQPEPQAGIFYNLGISTVAEIKKLLKLKTHIVSIAVTLSIFILILGIEIALANNTPPAGSAAAPKAALSSIKSVWAIFHFFCQYLNPIILAIIIAHQTGKEFEWKTFHQIQLKGQMPATYVASKLFTFFALAFVVYALHFIVAFGDYSIRAAISGETWDIPWLQISSDLMYSFIAVSIALLVTVLMVSASLGIVLTLVYVCVFEMVMFPLIGGLAKMLDKPAIGTALSYMPMKLPERLVNAVAGDDAFGAVIAVTAMLMIPVLAAYLSYLTVSRRQIGLIR